VADETNDQAQPEVTPAEVQQVETTQAPSGGDQPVAGEAVASSEIKVGNQSFKTQQDLAKAYEELQKGFTQKSQKYSEEIKSYKGLQDWLGGMTQEERSRFVQYVKGGATPQQAAQAATGQTQAPAQPAAAHPEIARMTEALEMVKAKQEAMEFRGKHPELTVEQLGKVADVVEEYEGRGVDLPLEAAYRIAFFEDRIAAAASDAQRKTEESIKRGKQAASLTPTAASAGVPPTTDKKFSTKAPVGEQNAMIKRLLKDTGANFQKK